MDAVRMIDPNTASMLDFLAKPEQEVSNYQRAIARFRREPSLIAIGAYICTMEIIADESCGTACTDCVRKIWYSPSYFNSMTVDECTSALIHETQHKFLNFFPRFERWAKQYKGQYSRRWLMGRFNVAQDYFINYMIKHEWMLPIKSTWMYNPKYNPTDHTTESIANELIREYEEQQKAPPEEEESGGEESEESGTAPDAEDMETGEEDEDDDDDALDDDDFDDDESGEDGDTDDESDEGEDDGTCWEDSELGEGDDIVLPEEYEGDIEKELDELDMQSLEMENRQDMSLAVRAAKACATDNRGVANRDPFSVMAEEAAFKTGYDFASELARHANVSNRRGRYTWFRPNRRMRTAQGLALPSRRGKSIGTAVFVIDSSGSTEGPVVRYFMDLVVKALKTVDYEKAVIIWCSDAVPTDGIQEFTKKEIEAGWRWDGRIRKAGYGTEFKPAFDVIEEHYPDVRCITYLTDGGVGNYDVDDAAAALKRMRNPPCLYLLIDESGYEYVNRFVEWVKDARAGRCAFLPMDRV